MDTDEVIEKYPQFFRAGEDVDDPFYEEEFFFVPQRSVWKDFRDVFPVDEDFDLESAENVFDDVILS